MKLWQRLQTLRHTLTGSLWFVPGLCVGIALGLAVGLIRLDQYLGHDWVQKNSTTWFGVGAEGSRGMLSSIAGSMMTVASLTFSLTISTLATASSQYTSRLIRNFMRDRVNQFVLGYFVGLFGYCLVVLRSIRSGDEGSFVPSVSVLSGLVLALISIGVLIYFIHHIAESIQASVILQRVTDETVEAIETLFPAGVAEPAGTDAKTPERADDARTRWHAAYAGRIGYVQHVDAETLVAVAEKHDTVVRMHADVGDFVSPRTTLCALAGVQEPDEDTLDELNSAFAIGSARTISQDPAFGVRQVVDICLKALSPGINDTTTGVMCVQHLGVILEAIAKRDVPDHARAKNGALRLIARGRSFESLLNLSIDQPRQNAKGNVAVLVALLVAIRVAARNTDDARRRRLLLDHAERVAAMANASVDTDYDRAAVHKVLAELLLEFSPLDPARADRWLPPRKGEPALAV